MLTTLEAVILGIIEGFTEFLPISSTGHIIIASKVLNIAESDFLKSFEIIIQLAAILAVLFLYGKRITNDITILKKVIVAFIPTGIIGFVLYKLIKNFLLGNISVVAWSLLIGGILIIFLESMLKNKKSLNKNLDQMSYMEAMLIGLIQSLAVIPGVSRSASTIIGGLVMGYDRKSIVEFSFLLAIPTMFAATGYDLLKSAKTMDTSQIDVLIIGFIVSFFVAMFSVKWLVKYINNNDFKIFGIYRILIAILLIAIY